MVYTLELVYVYIIRLALKHGRKMMIRIQMKNNKMIKRVKTTKKILLKRERKLLELTNF